MVESIGKYLPRNYDYSRRGKYPTYDQVRMFQVGDVVVPGRKHNTWSGEWYNSLDYGTLYRVTSVAMDSKFNQVVGLEPIKTGPHFRFSDHRGSYMYDGRNLKYYERSIHTQNDGAPPMAANPKNIQNGNVGHEAAYLVVCDQSGYVVAAVKADPPEPPAQPDLLTETVQVLTEQVGRKDSHHDHSYTADENLTETITELLRAHPQNTYTVFTRGKTARMPALPIVWSDLRT